MYLYHFFDRRTGPFRSLTDISREEAEDVIRKIRQERPDSQCAQRHSHYVEYRHNCEAILRREFAAKGGVMERESPPLHGRGIQPLAFDVVRAAGLYQNTC